MGLSFPSRSLQSVSCFLLIVSATFAPSFQTEKATESKDPQSIQVDVNLVTVGVHVTDHKKKTIAGLEESDFSIYEDGKQQAISFFAVKEQPVSLIIALDKSNSMGDRSGRMEQAKTAALALVNSALANDEIAYSTFHHEIFRLVELTLDHERVKSAITKTEAERGGSSPYDAIIEGLDRLRKAKYDRQAIVLLTDGADQHSNQKLNEVLKAVAVSQAQVFLIGYFNPKEDQEFLRSGKTLTLISGQEIDNPRYVFRRLAEESGAECFYPKSGSDLVKVMETISKDLQEQYTVAYHSSNLTSSSEYRSIQVKVAHDGSKVRARKGYLLGVQVGAAGEHESALASRQKIQAQPKPYEPYVHVNEGHHIYSDDFSQKTSGWPIKEGFSYQSGEYHIEIPGTAAANGPWMSDMHASISVEVKATLPKSGMKIETIGRDNPALLGSGQTEVVESLPGAGLVFRLNEKGFYALLISNWAGSNDVFFKLVRKDILTNEIFDILPWTRGGAEKSSKGMRRKLGVICQGDLIQLFVDERLVGSVHDQSLADGLAGMVVFGRAHGVFDDLVVEELKGTR
jgi:Ca-activated chloride channel family protein